MPKPTLEEIKAKADEYVKVAKSIARAEAARATDIEPLVEEQAAQMAEATASHDAKIGRLQTKADGLKAEVLAFLGPKTRTYAATGELAEFGVTVGTKAGPRVIDRDKFLKLCKKKGVDMWNIVRIMVEKADELLGTKEINEISAPSSTPTRDEYLRAKS